MVGVTSRPWHLGVAFLLVGALGALATLQYRWLGAVSRAERDQLERGLRLRGSAFATDVDRDLTRLIGAFQLHAASVDADPVAAVAGAMEQAARDTAAGRAVRAVFLADTAADAQRLRRYDPDARALVDAEWPAELSAVRERVARMPVDPALPGLPSPLAVLGTGVDPAAPALFTAVMPDPLVLRDTTSRGQFADSPESPRVVVLWLDQARLASEVLAPLFARHFGDDGGMQYAAAVRHGPSPAPPVYLSDASAEAVSPGSADLVLDLFRIRLEDLPWTRTLAAEGPRPGPDRVSIRIFRRGGPEHGPGRTALAGEPPAWQLLLQARDGSLEAVVSRSRTRNMAISVGILALLGASVLLAMAAAAREQRAARQQIAFVASVSHELRTPLAVIRSAAENLADGVVSGAQVAEYGALIRTEGRRLTDMVERVMDFAGLTAGTAARARRDVMLADIVSSAVDALASEARERSQQIHVSIADGAARVLADADGLRSALQNAIGNALKYSAAGGDVEVVVSAAGGRARVTVLDRGIGIDAEDLRHVFTPFFRGRRAVASEVRGSGIGLSLVEKVMQAHGGYASIGPREGGGTVLTLDLPLHDGAPAA